MNSWQVKFSILLLLPLIVSDYLLTLAKLMRVRISVINVDEWGRQLIQSVLEVTLTRELRLLFNFQLPREVVHPRASELIWLLIFKLSWHESVTLRSVIIVKARRWWWPLFGHAFRLLLASEGVIEVLDCLSAAFEEVTSRWDSDALKIVIFYILFDIVITAWSVLIQSWETSITNLRIKSFLFG